MGLGRIMYWVYACRFRTLPLSISVVGVGMAMAYRAGLFSWGITLWLFLTAFFLQLLSNFANDVGDSIHGIDDISRVGPLRMVSSGKIGKLAMRRAMFLAAIASFASGMVLLWVSLWGYWFSFALFFMLGVLAIGLAVFYSYGLRPYGHSGWGDLWVWVCFGILGVCGSYFLYTRCFSWRY